MDTDRSRRLEMKGRCTLMTVVCLLLALVSLVLEGAWHVRRRRTRVEQRRVAMLREGSETCLICVQAVFSVDASDGDGHVSDSQRAGRVPAFVHRS